MCAYFYCFELRTTNYAFCQDFCRHWSSCLQNACFCLQIAKNRLTFVCNADTYRLLYISSFSADVHTNHFIILFDIKICGAENLYKIRLCSTTYGTPHGSRTHLWPLGGVYSIQWTREACLQYSIFNVYFTNNFLKKWLFESALRRNLSYPFN